MQCYHGWHILLAIIALISLLMLGLMIPLIAAALHFRFIRRKVCGSENLFIIANFIGTLSHQEKSCRAFVSDAERAYWILFEKLFK